MAGLDRMGVQARAGLVSEANVYTYSVVHLLSAAVPPRRHGIDHFWRRRDLRIQAYSEIASAVSS